jgi:hypothetical protein
MLLLLGVSFSVCQLSACLLICLSAFICLFNSSACSIHLPVQFICLFHSSACLVLSSYVPVIWISFHLPIYSFPCPLLCLSFHLPVHSSACLFTFVLFIYTCPFICTAQNLSSYFKFTTCSDSRDKAHSTPSQPKWAEIATCTTLPFLSDYKKCMGKQAFF